MLSVVAGALEEAARGGGAAAVLAPAFDEVEAEKFVPAGLTPPPCCCAAEPERCRVTRGDRRMPTAAGADAGDSEEGTTSPSGGSLRLLVLLLLFGLEFMVLRKQNEAAAGRALRSPGLGFDPVKDTHRNERYRQIARCVGTDDGN